MIEYLRTSCPNAYVYKTKFGDLMYDMDKERHFEMMTYSNLSLYREKIVDQLQSLFGCSDYQANSVYYTWKHTLPKYERMETATNNEVLVPIKTELNTTV